METISRGKGREILSKLFQSGKSGLRKQKKSCPQLISWMFIPKSRGKSVRGRKNLTDIEPIFTCIHNYITNDIKNEFYNI